MTDEVHHVATRGSLWSTATALEVEAQEADRQGELYQLDAASSRAKAETLRRRAAAIRTAAEVLGQLDKSGLTGPSLWPTENRT